MRILLFLGTNIAIMALLGLTFSLFGIQGLLAENGVDLNLSVLLVYAMVIGFSGAFISLFLSKFLAKRSMRVQVIINPENQTVICACTFASKSRSRSFSFFTPMSFSKSIPA